MTEQTSLQQAATDSSLLQNNYCPCGCGQTIAALDTNPEHAGSRPFISRDGLKIWLAHHTCTARAEQVFTQSKKQA
jgi:hypothetical protein